MASGIICSHIIAVRTGLITELFAELDQMKDVASGLSAATEDLAKNPRRRKLVGADAAGRNDAVANFYWITASSDRGSAVRNKCGEIAVANRRSDVLIDHRPRVLLRNPKRIGKLGKAYLQNRHSLVGG